MNLQRLLSLTRSAVDDYNMIQEGDKVAVGLSGGKDSAALLIALSEMKKFYPKKYDVTAITVSLGFEGFDTSPMRFLCDKLGVQYSAVETNIGAVVFDHRKEANPCALCSKMRKGTLYNEALRLGCNKVALGHSKDDVLITFFMAMLYEGRFHTFSPVTYLDRKKIYLFRPLIYTSEKDIKSFIKKSDVEIVKNPCPADGNTKREQVKRFLAEQSIIYDHLNEKVFGLIQRTPVAGWERGGLRVE